MTARDDPNDPCLEDLLRAALLVHDPLAGLVEEHICALVSALDGREFRADLRQARTGRPPLPDEEEAMRLRLALHNALKAIAKNPPRRLPEPPSVVPQGGSASPVFAEAARDAVGGTDRAIPSPVRDVAAPGWDALERINDGIEETFQAFARSTEVQVYLGPDPLPRKSLLNQWKSYFLALLRLPPVVAVQWTTKITNTIPRAWLEPGDGWLQVPTEAAVPKILVPAFHDKPGVVAMPDAPLDELVGTALGDQVLQYRNIAAVACQMLWLASEDRTAYYAQSTDLTQLPDRYAHYATTLREKLSVFSKTASSGADPETVVIRAAQLTEVLRSVVHRPLAASGSWWTERRDVAMAFVRATAEKHAPELRVRDLRGSYREITAKRESDPANDIRLAVDDPTSVGTVFDCLRPSLGTDIAVIRPGRVIYGGDHAERR